MHEVRHALLAVEGIFLLRGLGFVEVSADEQKSVLLHARDIVVAVLAKRRACAPHAPRPKLRRNERRVPGPARSRAVSPVSANSVGPTAHTYDRFWHLSDLLARWREVCLLRKFGQVR